MAAEYRSDTSEQLRGCLSEEVTIFSVNRLDVSACVGRGQSSKLLKPLLTSRPIHEPPYENLPCRFAAF